MKTVMLCSVVVFALLMCGTSQALVVDNYSFEDFTITDNGGNPEPPPGTQLEVWNGFDAADGAASGWWDGGTSTWYEYPGADVTSWNTTGAMLNSGTLASGGTDGNAKAWLGDGMEVWNLTSNLAVNGETYVLTMDALNDWTGAGADPTIRMTLFYDDGGRVDIGSVDQVLALDWAWYEYSNAFVAPAAADGKALGIAFQNVTGNGDSYLHVDNVRLVPEPATMMLLGLGGLFLRRRK